MSFDWTPYRDIVTGEINILQAFLDVTMSSGDYAKARGVQVINQALYFSPVRSRQVAAVLLIQALRA